MILKTTWSRTLVGLATVAVVAATALPSAAAPDKTPPTTPTGLHVVSLTEAGVTLGWNASTDNSGSFRYVLTQNGSVHWSLSQNYTTSTRPLASGTTHTFAIKAVDYSANASGYSNTLTVTIPADQTPPTAPQVSLVSTGVSEITVEWTLSTDNVPGPLDYDVLINGEPGRNLMPTWNGPREVVAMQLTPGTSYDFAVRALDAAGNTTTGNTVIASTLTTSDTSAPSSPANLRVQLTKQSSVKLLWNPASDNVGVDAYEIYANGVLVDEVGWDIWYPGPPENRREVRLLTPGTSYTFTVKARDIAGNVSAASNTIASTTLPSTDTTPPSPPAISYGSVQSCAWTNLGWSGAADNSDTASQLSYEIYEDGVLLDADSFAIGGSAQGNFGTRTYRVRAVDRAGNPSVLSNEFALRHKFSSC